jgi:hypothetical protein
MRASKQPDSFGSVGVTNFEGYGHKDRRVADGAFGGSDSGDFVSG